MEIQKEELFKIHDREIFKIIEQTEENTDVKKFTLTLGKYKIKEFETIELADLYLMERPYELLLALITITYKTIMEVEENEKN